MAQVNLVSICNVGHRFGGAAERFKAQGIILLLYFAVVCAFPLFFGAFVPGVNAATLTWTDGTGNFTNAANWNPAQAPVAGDTTLFTNDTSYTVTFTANAVNMNSNFFNGHAGTVTLDITGFSWVLTNNSATAGRGAFVVGQAAGTTGTVYLAGGSLFVTNAGGNARLLVGGSGIGSFFLTNGAVVVNRTILGDTATGLGTLVLNGSGVTYSNSSTFNIGNAAGSTGNSLVISNSAALTSASTFTLGASSGGNSLLVDTGGKLFTLNQTPVIGSGTSNNTATISGSGAKWDAGGQSFTLGSGGATGNVLTISGGGLVTNVAATTIGSGVGANGNSLVVMGAGSVWTNTSTIVVGSSSSFNTMIITNGGKVSSAGSAAAPTRLEAAAPTIPCWSLAPARSGKQDPYLSATETTQWATP